METDTTSNEPNESTRIFPVKFKPKETKRIRITVIGNAMVGKTSMLVTYTQNAFPTDPAPTVMENYQKDIEVDGQMYKTLLLDIASQEGYKKLRVLCYPDTKCFIICYSVESQTDYVYEYEDVVIKWYQEIKSYCTMGIPVLLVGTKSDLRQGEKKCISEQEGMELGKKIKAVKYIECSALNNDNLDIILFQEAVRATIVKRTRWYKCCNIL